MALRQPKRLSRYDRRQVGRWITGLVISALPLAAVGLSQWHANAGLVYAGILPAVTALLVDARVAAGVVLLTPALMFAGLVLGPTPWAGAVLLAAVGAATGWVARYGLATAGTYVAVEVALATIAQPDATFLLVRSPTTLRNAVEVAAYVLVAGMWVVVVGTLLLHDIPRRRPDPVPARVAREYGAVLAVLAGGFGWAALSWLPGGNSWWVLLTLFVVLQPTTKATRDRAVQRILGTVAGAAAASVLALAIQSPRATAPLGAVLALLTLAATLSAPYWLYTTALTMTIIVTTFAPQTVEGGGRERILFTVVGAVATAAVSTAAHWLLSRARPVVPAAG
ncbi:FUSC family protein [Kineosporia sp. A_224]|uniref:FUSC family protein n=1 Tax=Kineosporia sp. A_224 TaxID=1962180 RepID=UPI000B4C197A|nr:FUSC family protein [Kineosporia sp. A_224]